MSIEKIAGQYVPTCDICGDTLPPEKEFNEATHALKEEGWVIKKVDKYYEHYCNVCQKGG